MNRILPICCAVILVASGCRSTAPKAASTLTLPFTPGATNLPAAKPTAPSVVTQNLPPAQVKTDAKSAEISKQQREQLRELEKSLSERRAAQVKLEKQMDDLREDLFEAAQAIRDVKLRADTLTAAQSNNMSSIRSLQDSLGKLEVPPSPEFKALQAALALERHASESNAAALQQSQKDLADLKKQLQAPSPAAPPVAAVLAPAPATTSAPAPVVVAPSPVPAPVGNPSSPAQLVADGKLFLRQGKLPDAERSFQAALTQSPNLLGARIGLAACRYNAGDLDQAKRLVADVLAIDAHNAQALGLKGIIAWREGRNRDAVEILNQAVRADPSDAQLHNYMGVAFHARERYADATEELRTAVKLDPDNGEAQYNLSVILATARSPLLLEAKTHYELALQLGYPHDEAMDKILYSAQPH